MMLLISIVFSLLSGGILCFFPFRDKKEYRAFAMATTCITAALSWYAILTTNGEILTLFRVYGVHTLAFRADGMGKVFGALASTLWPITMMYAMEYMRHEPERKTFYGFFVASFGVTLGIAFAANLLTMYIFYEMLTVSTMPLVLFPLTEKAIRASRHYLYFSLGGAAIGFMGMAFLLFCGTDTTFVFGGIQLNLPFGGEDMLRLAYVFTFLGFGVKAAVFPLHSWLPEASVAPTPVTALLHAVAVVKAGAFAVIRSTFYCFGPDLLRGTWAQHVVLSLCIVTIVFGSAVATKRTHLKLRLAYSTIANLSYILFGVCLMTPAGLIAGVLHLLFHSIIKIGAFFMVGAIMHQTGFEFLTQINGLAKRMPIMFGSFIVFSLSLSGIPPFNGFFSKWFLAEAALDSGSVLGLVGICGLLISAFLTAMYMLEIVIRGYFPPKDVQDLPATIKDPSWHMTIPVVALAVACLLSGLFAHTWMSALSALIL